MPEQAHFSDEQRLVAGRHEDDAELLQRSFDRVEQLLHHLELGAPTEAERTDGTVPMAAGVRPDRAGEPHGTPHATANGHRPAADMPVGSTVEAEVLRITLSAQGEANRVRAEAAQLRVDAAAEGERLLTEAKRLSERIQADARADAQRLREQAEQALADARAEAEEIRANAEAARPCARDTLHGAGQSVTDALESLETVNDAVQAGLASLNVTAGRLDSLLRITKDIVSAPSAQANPAATEPTGERHVIAGLFRGDRQ